MAALSQLRFRTFSMKGACKSWPKSPAENYFRWSWLPPTIEHVSIVSMTPEMEWRIEPRNLLKLRTLSIKDSSNFENEGLWLIFCDAPQLEEVELSGLPKLTANAFIGRDPETENSKLTKERLDHATVARMTKLTKLRIADCKLVTPKMIRALRSESLREFCMTGCAKASDEEIDFCFLLLLMQNPNLRQVECEISALMDVQELKRKYPELDFVEVKSG